MLKNEQLQGWWELAKKSDTPFWPRAVRDLILSHIEALAEVDRTEHAFAWSLRNRVSSGGIVLPCEKDGWTSAQWFEAKRKEVLGE